MSTFIASRCTSCSRTTSPLMGPLPYFGNRIATSGQTREQAGQSVLQLSWFCTVICFFSSTPYTSKRQNVRHCMQLVQRSKSITGNHGFHASSFRAPAASRTSRAASSASTSPRSRKCTSCSGSAAGASSSRPSTSIGAPSAGATSCPAIGRVTSKPLSSRADRAWKRSSPSRA